jgi:large subunit ribosomal protein L35
MAIKTAKKVKAKTHSGAKKRFSLTKTGKVKYQKTNKRHRLTQKDTKRKRIARGAGIASEADAANIRVLIPYK